MWFRSIGVCFAIDSMQTAATKDLKEREFNSPKKSYLEEIVHGFLVKKLKLCANTDRNSSDVSSYGSICCVPKSSTIHCSFFL